MTKKPIINLGRSIKAKLLNIAKKEGRDFDNVLLQYFQECFLYRLSISPYKENLILKGALLFLSYNIPRTRPTKDIDFLGVGEQILDDCNIIRNIIKEIASIQIDENNEKINDGVVFDTNEIKIKPIDTGKKAIFTARLPELDEAPNKATHNTFKIDIGFGDHIVPASFISDFPILLEKQKIPNLYVYSIESSIAEKFEAIVKLKAKNSRLKDFYDIIYLAKNREFSGEILCKAIKTTFNQRNRLLSDRKNIFSDEFKQNLDKQKQWLAFLRRNKLQTYNKFPIVIEYLEKFLEPICKEDCERP